MPSCVCIKKPDTKGSNHSLSSTGTGQDNTAVSQAVKIQKQSYVTYRTCWDKTRDALTPRPEDHICAKITKRVICVSASTINGALQGAGLGTFVGYSLGVSGVYAVANTFRPELSGNCTISQGASDTLWPTDETKAPCVLWSMIPLIGIGTIVGAIKGFTWGLNDAVKHAVGHGCDCDCSSLEAEELIAPEEQPMVLTQPTESANLETTGFTRTSSIRSSYYSRY